jgi:L-ascorbate metabolism protein UlaG (beta-lactamase superfamily)
MGSLLEHRTTPDADPFRIYITGDTLFIPELHQIVERTPKPDAMVAHLGGTRILGLLVTMDAQQGADLVELIDPAVTVPIHFNDYSVFRSPLSDFRAEVERRSAAGRIGSLVRYVTHGDSVDLSV